MPQAMRDANDAVVKMVIQQSKYHIFFFGPTAPSRSDNGDSYTVVDPCGAESIVSLGKKPLCFRGSITVPGRRRPLRHLVSCSLELGDNTSDGKPLLVSDDSLFIWSSLVCHYGHAGIGAVDGLSVTAAETYSASSGVWVRRCRHHGKAERVTGLTAERIAGPLALPLR